LLSHNWCRIPADNCNKKSVDNCSISEILYTSNNNSSKFNRKKLLAGGRRQGISEPGQLGTV
jgi:hypothetical protein